MQQVIARQTQQINDFLSSYSILRQEKHQILIASPHQAYLIKNIQITPQTDKNSQQNQIRQIIDTLSQHLNFQHKNYLKLLDFHVLQESSRSQRTHLIRATYQYGRKSLLQQIQARKENQEEQYFEEEALWGLLYSLSDVLNYLQSKNVIYGVIDPKRIFFDKNIQILDPSSTGIDPYTVTPGRLYSPQILCQERELQQIDMFKADVFCLGLVMLECALLKVNLHQYDEKVLNMCLKEVQQYYSQEFCGVISKMLRFQPQGRPSFQDLVQMLGQSFQIENGNSQVLCPMFPDKQCQENHLWEFGQSQEERIDLLMEESIRASSKDSSLMSSRSRRVTAYEEARFKFLDLSSIRESFENDDQDGSLLESNSRQTIDNFSDSPNQGWENKTKRQINCKENLQKFYVDNFALKTLQKQRPSKKTSQHKESQSSGLKKNQKQKRTYEKEKRTNEKENRTFQNINRAKQIKDKLVRHEDLNTSLLNKAEPVNTFQNLRYRPGNEREHSKENLFTHPQIMQMIQKDIKKIQEKKKTFSITINGNRKQITNSAVTSNFTSRN